MRYFDPHLPFLFVTRISILGPWFWDSICLYKVVEGQGILIIPTCYTVPMTKNRGQKEWRSRKRSNAYKSAEAKMRARTRKEKQKENKKRGWKEDIDHQRWYGRCNYHTAGSSSSSWRGWIWGIYTFSRYHFERQYFIIFRPQTYSQQWEIVLSTRTLRFWYVFKCICSLQKR